MTPTEGKKHSNDTYTTISTTKEDKAVKMSSNCGQNHQKGAKMPINELIQLHKRYGLPHLRLGQFFVSRYIKNTWPALFYQQDDKVSLSIIEEWLNEHHYYTNLPQAVYKVENQDWFKEVVTDDNGKT